MSSFSDSLSAVPDGGGGKSSEYELAEQDAQHGGPPELRPDTDGMRPDQRPVPGNPPVHEQDVQRGRDQLERVIAK